MSTAIAPIRAMRDELTRYVPRMVEVVGQRGADEYARRQIGLAMLAAQKNPDLQRCDPASVAAAMIRVCGWRLEIGHTAHLVPFGRDCTAIPDWKGLVELMIRSGHVRDVYAEAVYSNDRFAMTRGTAPTIEHEPALKERGELVGFYAVAVLRFGRTTFDYMSVADVEKIRTKARSGNSPAWKERYDEMGKKTVIRRLAKRMPQSDALRSALGIEEESGIPALTLVDGEAPATQPSLPSSRALSTTGQDVYEADGQGVVIEEPEKPRRATSYRTPAPGRIADAIQPHHVETAKRAAAQPDPYEPAASDDAPVSDEEVAKFWDEAEEIAAEKAGDAAELPLADARKAPKGRNAIAEP